MRRKTANFACLLVGAVILTTVNSRTESLAQKPTLPGAAAVIDAATFPSLQAALDAVPAEGGTVRIPPGHFEISEPLVVHTTDTTIEGAGAATHIENRSENGAPAIVLENPEYRGKRPPKAETLWRVRLADFRLTGTPKSGHGIVARYVDEIFLQGLTVTHHGGDGILLDHCYEDPRVSDCLMTYNKGTGLRLLGCHDIVVSACQFEENDDALECSDGFNLCMTGCCVDDHLGRGVVIANTYGSTLTGNMIEECAGAAVVLQRDCYGITVSANVIAHNGAGVRLEDAHGCAVSANTLVLMKSDALYAGPQAGRITVTGNSFCDSFIGGGEVKRAEGDRQAAGIVLDGAPHCTIVGNTFSGLHTKPITVRGDTPQGVLVESNVFVGNTGETDLPNR